MPTSLALVRRPDPMLWELRRAWATGRRVSLTLVDNAGRRVEGHVRAVSATGASVNVNGILVPVESILGVHMRSRWMDEDTTWEEGGQPFHGRARRVLPQSEELPGIQSPS